MAIQVGDKIPSVTLKHLSDGGMAEITTDEIFSGKKVVMFAVPGAFTPTCHNAHLPGYIQRVDDLRAKGVDSVVCLAVNDPFVMKAWGTQSGADGKVIMLPDGNGEFTRAMGLEMDGSGYGLGERSQRFAMVVDSGTVSKIEIEPGSGVTVSGADHILEAI